MSLIFSDAFEVGWIFNDYVIANSLPSVPVKELQPLKLQQKLGIFLH